jgi:hypothetical protein
LLFIAQFFLVEGDWGNFTWCMVLTCLFCRMSLRQVWSWWRQLWQRLQLPSFVCVMCCGEAFHGLECQRFDSGWCFISVKCGSSV